MIQSGNGELPGSSTQGASPLADTDVRSITVHSYMFPYLCGEEVDKGHGHALRSLGVPLPGRLGRLLPPGKEVLPPAMQEDFVNSSD
jgi:hypothetical protein